MTIWLKPRSATSCRPRGTGATSLSPRFRRVTKSRASPRSKDLRADGGSPHNGRSRIVEIIWAISARFAADERIVVPAKVAEEQVPPAMLILASSALPRRRWPARPFTVKGRSQSVQHFLTTTLWRRDSLSTRFYPRRQRRLDGRQLSARLPRATTSTRPWDGRSRDC